uniref:Uncharacterized protein n=1 Tax=Octactis speculum TaxID=3111310 RepID=A0A7S2CHS2_9STRA|mmetsp:Transcript_36313/g.49132  ORF Transcript_36313/g.49132 Transcript_36313/m.49132 type:complete len:167 (+) Transcript_36313:53-553(+)
MHWSRKPFAPASHTSVHSSRPFAVELNRWADHTDCFMLKHEDVFFHELSHVYNATIGRDHEGIVAMYARAVEDGRYDWVKRLDGSEARAYGLNNHLEFFASLSVPFFHGTNDYFPFTYSDLQAFDPASFRDLGRIWGELGDQPNRKVPAAAAPPVAATPADDGEGG